MREKMREMVCIYAYAEMSERGALFGYAVWAEIDYCEKYAPKSPCIQMK